MREQLSLAPFIDLIVKRNICDTFNDELAERTRTKDKEKLVSVRIN